jgi:hypothetical protein
MNKSDTIEMLASSLSKFQGEIQNCFKGKTGYGYKYADLASILDDVRPILAKYELSILQMPSNDPESVTLETMLMHSSGQWISETMRMPIESAKGMSRAQTIGSVISYARRYALTSFLGISQTDDDTDAAPVVEKREAEITPHQALANLLVELKIPKERVAEVYKQMGFEKFGDIPAARFKELLSLVTDGVVNG